MSDDLSIQGTLAETTVPDLFRSLLRTGETGIVSLEASGRHDNVYIREGKIIFATTSDSDLGLAEVLLQSGDLNLHQYITAVEDVTTQKRLGSVLCERGYLKPEELVRAMERQVAIIVMDALGFRTGSYTIDFGSDFPNEILSLSIHTERLVLDGVTKIEQWSLIERGAGRMTRLLRQTPGSDTRAYHLDLTEEENHIYGLLQEPQTLESVCERSYLSNFNACRMAWALLAVNLIDDAEQSDIRYQRAAVESEFELEAEVERYNSTFQRIFGLLFQEIGDHSYDFVDRVVLQLSPEVLPYLSGINLLNEGRVDFDQLQTNIISSGASDHARVADSVMNDLLYSWILEIKKEFKGRLEGEMAIILEGLKR
ncbi:MAG TPA: DUF4388 domain-containing protein [Thermoanaerobaculia bacterium]|nr:DUF4388 domain-containing protein [Thermoanaerobaculia bacterium]